MATDPRSAQSAENSRYRDVEQGLKAGTHLPQPPPLQPVDTFSTAGSLSVPAPGELARTSTPLRAFNSSLDPVEGAVAQAPPFDLKRR